MTKNRRVVLMFEKRFVNRIEQFTKTHTIRGPRKRPIRVGDLLSLRYWKGKAYRSRQVVMREFPCKAIQMVTIEADAITIGEGGPLSLEDSERFAWSDGFQTFKAMIEWHREAHGLPFVGELIEWGAAKLA